MTTISSSLEPFLRWIWDLFFVGDYFLAFEGRTVICDYTSHLDDAATRWDLAVYLDFSDLFFVFFVFSVYLFFEPDYFFILDFFVSRIIISLLVNLGFSFLSFTLCFLLLSLFLFSVLDFYLVSFFSCLSLLFSSLRLIVADFLLWVDFLLFFDLNDS